MNLSEFIGKVGIQKIADFLNMTTMSVYDWKNLKSAPKPETAWKLIEFSNGVLDWESIYLPYVYNKVCEKNPAQKNLI